MSPLFVLLFTLLPSAQQPRNGVPTTAETRITPGALEPPRQSGPPIEPADYAERVERRIAALEASVANAAPREAADAELDAAELILTRGLEPHLSRELLEVADAADQRAILQLTRRALALLDSADKRIAAADPPWPDEFSERAAAARAYGELFAAMARAAAQNGTSRPTSASVGDDGDRLVTACRGLASLIDSASPPVSASARLWQAAAYRRAGRPDRALKVLPLTNTALQVFPTDFFARLERCRALDDAGQTVAALALLLQIEQRHRVWLPETMWEQGAHAIRLLRAQIARRWAARLPEDQVEGNAAALEELAAAARAEIREQNAGALRPGAAVGGMNAQLGEPAKPAAAIFDITLAEPVIALVTDVGRAEERAWGAVRDALVGLPRRLQPTQSLAIFAARADAALRFPTSAAAALAPAEARRAEQFLVRLRPGQHAGADVVAALQDALAIKPGVVVLVASSELPDDQVAGLAERLAVTKTKLHVIWLGGTEGGAALRKLAAGAGGRFHPVAPPPTSASTHAPGESEPEEDEPAP